MKTIFFMNAFGTRGKPPGGQIANGLSPNEVQIFLPGPKRVNSGFALASSLGITVALVESGIYETIADPRGRAFASSFFHGQLHFSA
ncbi:MAG: hypothetical protein ACRD5R_10755 [Candidatus Acidiferrales bacterium]